MTIRQSYEGVVREGCVELPTTALLAEGSQVLVLPTKPDKPLLDPYLARRKANGWLAMNVGLVMAQQPQLTQQDGTLAWQFKVILTRIGERINQAVGTVLVNAYDGTIITDLTAANEMIANANALASSLPPTNS